MKKILFIIIAICLGFTACKKEHSKETNPTNQALHKVSFSVGFSQQTANFQLNRHTGISSIKGKTLATGLVTQVDMILYAVFDSVGNQVHTITQLSSDANFGSYTDNLHSGNYTVVVVAGKTGIQIGPPVYATSVNSLSTDVISYGYYLTTTSNGYFSNVFNKDAFYKKFALVVTSTDSNQSITLDRITSEVTVNIQDAIPAGTKTIGFNINGIGSVFNVGTGQVVATNALGNFYTVDTLASTDIGKTNYTISAIFLYKAPVTVDLYASTVLPVPSPAFNITAEKIISSVAGHANAQTILTGNLFGGSGTTGTTGGFTTQIDTSWNPTPITKTFP